MKKYTAFSFLFFYIIGIFIFWCNSSYVVVRCTKILVKWRHLTEEEGRKLCGTYCAKILFQTVMMGIFPSAFKVYTIVNDLYGDRYIVTSGLFTIIWLLLTGIMIKVGYYLILHRKVFKVFKLDSYYQNKEFLWVMCPILYGILFNFYDNTIFLTILSIVLGKFVWMDSFEIVSWSMWKRKVKEFWKRTRDDIFLLVCQASVVGYFIISWYVTGKTVYIEANIASLMILAFGLMPIIDMRIWKMLNAYVDKMIELRR